MVRRWTDGTMLGKNLCTLQPGQAVSVYWRRSWMQGLTLMPGINSLLAPHFKTQPSRATWPLSSCSCCGVQQ